MESYRFYYQHLSPVEKKVYEQLAKGIAAHDQAVKVMGTGGQVKKILPMVFLDNPQFFYVDTTQYAVASGGVFATANVGYHKSMEETRAMEQTLEKIAGRFLEEVRQKRLNNLMTVKYAHDFVIRNTEYSMESLNSGQVYGDVSSMTGVFFKHRAVCGGISMAAKWLLDKAGIPSGVIEGQLREPGSLPKSYTGAAGENNHAWNLVCPKDDWSYMDVTMDLGASPNKKILSYDYFLRSEREMQKYMNYLRPGVSCEKELDSYFARNHTILTQRDQIGKYAAFCRQNKRKRIYFEAAGQIAQLAPGELLSLAVGGMLGGYQHRYNDRLQIMDIQMM